MRGKLSSKRNRKLALAAGVSLLVHGVVGSALWGRAVMMPVMVVDTPAIWVELVEAPLSAGPVGQSGGQADAQVTDSQAEVDEPAATPTAPVAAPTVRKPKPAPVNIPSLDVAVTESVSTMRLLGAAEMAGAVRAGTAGGAGAGHEGTGSGGGGPCDMAGRLQAMLRRDARALATVRQAQRALEAGDRAMHVWDGDWVQSAGQSGRGLAGLRQAIAVEVAFAPRECRTAQMRGLVVLSLGEAPSDPQIALGAELWRWEMLSRP